MDIHKPKAAHSWREFLTEIGTIICGVVIALGLEQMVESFRRDAEVREAREALHAEIRSNLAALAFGMRESQCISDQLPAFVAWAANGPRAPELRTQLGLFRFSTWESVKPGAVPHMPLKERLALSTFYDDLANEQRVVEEERSAARALFGASERARLDVQDARETLNAVAFEHRLAEFYVGNAQGLLSQAKALGVAAPKLDASALRDLAEICGGRARAGT